MLNWWLYARRAGYFATVFALASTTGPVLGAYLTEHFSWRAVFAINVPLGIVAAALALRVPHAPLPARAGPFRPDVVGAVLFCATTATSRIRYSIVADRSRIACRSRP